jgi:tripartite ATP-independent transporter DctM subunit
MSATQTLTLAEVSPRTSQLWHRLEDWLLTLVLTAMCLVPVVELILRASLHTGIFGAASIVQHLGLAVGMLGAAVATRERRLLTITAFALLIPKSARAPVTAFADGLAVAVCVLLVAAGVAFVAAERSSGTTIAYGVPTWCVELLMPAGFLLIGWRLLTRVAAKFWSRAVAVALCLLLAWLTTYFSMLPQAPMTIGCVALALGALLGMPLFAVLAGTSALLFWHAGLPLAALAVDHYRTVVNPTLPAIPLFTLAGYLLAESHAPQRLINVFDALFGRLRGGAAIVTVLSCVFFTSFTGASGATVLALGGLVMPLLLANGYAPRAALGLVTAAGLPGTLLMPALPLILYAVVAGVSIQQMFLGGLLPALLLAGITIAWGMRGESHGSKRSAPLDVGRIRRAIAAAKWELSVPLVPFGALASGIATPVESAALTAVYVLFITTIAHHDLDLRRDVPRVMSECGLIIGGILIVMGVALGLTDYLVDAQVPDAVVAWVNATVGSRIGFLLALNVFLLAAGCLIEIYPAIMVLAPIVTQLGQVFGIEPVHLGIIFLANMELGYLTPLVGLNLFFASYRFNKPLAEIFRAVLPLFLALAIGVLIITYVPWLSLWLPGLAPNR